MLNVHSSNFEPEPAPSAPPATRNHLAVRFDAGASALPRLANLLAKLDIEPRWMQVETSACGSALDVKIDLGPDREAKQRLALRLQGMVTVQEIAPDRAA
jgi:hypothetical protein